MLKLRWLGLSRVPLRPLRGLGFALGQPDAFGAGAFPLRSFASNNHNPEDCIILLLSLIHI